MWTSQYVSTILIGKLRCRTHWHIYESDTAHLCRTNVAICVQILGLFFYHLQFVRSEHIHRSYGILLIGDASALHLTLYLIPLINAHTQLIANLLRFAKFYAKLILIDVVDQLRAVVCVIVEAKCQVVRLSQVVCIFDFDILPIGTF